MPTRTALTPLPRPESSTTGLGSGKILNDVHSRLNPTRVAAVVPVRSADELAEATRWAARRGLAISTGGGRHAMGGQQFGKDTLHLDTRQLCRVLDFDSDRGRLEVEAGIQWPELIQAYLSLQKEGRPRWGIAQKQTGADRMTLGGSLAANAHGRGLILAPFVADVEAFTLVDATGALRRCNRRRNQELFALAAGGYGLFGVVTTLTLRLQPRRKLRRVVRLERADGLIATFAARIAAGHLYGDFQFEIDPASEGFLTRGVLACYEPVPDSTPIPDAQKELTSADWLRLLDLAHVDKSRAFQEYAGHYLATDGQIYFSDTHQLSQYPEGYHREVDRRARRPGSEMISELYVPRSELASFLTEAAAELRRARADVVYGTVRLIERDTDSFLAWAREPWACVVVNLHVEHTSQGIDHARSCSQALIDLALDRGGSFYLTYHRWATRQQLIAAYPQTPSFLERKLAYDPDELFASDWYRWLKRLVGPGQSIRGGYRWKA